MAALSCGRVLLDAKTIILSDHVKMVIGSADQLCQGTFPDHNDWSGSQSLQSSNCLQDFEHGSHYIVL